MPIGVYYHKPRKQWVKDKISNSMKGKKPKNFDLLQTKTLFTKGHNITNTGITRFKKGMIPWNKNKKRPEMLGEKHPMWKGGTYEKNRKIDMGRKYYKNWKKLVLERDNYTCIWCKSSEKLNVDHIKSYSAYPSLRYDMNNGRVLCVKCHKKTESYGLKNQLVKGECLYANI